MSLYIIEITVAVVEEVGKKSCKIVKRMEDLIMDSKQTDQELDADFFSWVIMKKI